MHLWKDLVCENCAVTKRRGNAKQVCAGDPQPNVPKGDDAKFTTREKNHARTYQTYEFAV